MYFLELGILKMKFSVKKEILLKNTLSQLMEVEKTAADEQ